MEFAFTLKPDMTPERLVNLTKLAEAEGFAYGWGIRFSRSVAGPVSADDVDGR